MKAGKAWGQTELVFSAPTCELHRIHVEPGGFCSKHLHQSKWNAFYVLRGSLVVEVWKMSGTVDKTRLLAGDGMTVAPGELHRFMHDDADAGVTEALELYYTALDPGDIQREDVGGMRDVT